MQLLKVTYTENMTVIVGESCFHSAILVKGTRISGYLMLDFFFPVMSYFGKQLYHLLILVLYGFN